MLLYYLRPLLSIKITIQDKKKHTNYIIIIYNGNRILYAMKLYTLGIPIVMNNNKKMVHVKFNAPTYMYIQQPVKQILFELKNKSS